jgi:hypothetical protein
MKALVDIEKMFGIDRIVEEGNQPQEKTLSFYR